MAEMELPAAGVHTFRVEDSPALEPKTVFKLEAQRLVIGSDPDEAQIVIPEIKVSGSHAVLVWEGESYSIFDKDSTTGTRVNGEELKMGHRLTPGDVIKIGDTELVYIRKTLIGEGGAAGMRKLVLDLVVIGLVLGVAFAVVKSREIPREPPKLNFNSDKTEDTFSANDRKDGYFIWDAHSFKVDLKPDANLAKFHLMRGMKSAEEKTLDPSNAFSAIIDLRKAKAYVWGNRNNPELVKKTLDIAEVDAAIKECREYLMYQKDKYWDDYYKSVNLGNVRHSLESLKRLQFLFSDRFSNEKSEEFKFASEYRNNLESQFSGYRFFQ